MTSDDAVLIAISTPSRRDTTASADVFIVARVSMMLVALAIS